MKSIATIFITFAISTACTNIGPIDMRMQSRQVIDYCLREVGRFTGEPLSSEADNAYLYVTEEGYAVHFTHGAVGTFGRRSLDYRVVLGCAVLKGPPMKLVYLSVPFKDPMIEESGRSYLDGAPEGATEILFKREGEKFKYCCDQPFDEKNIDRNNPNFPWKVDRVGP